MSEARTVTVDASQFPEQASADLLVSLGARRIAPKLLYESRRQAQKWLALHEAHSPARRDPGCAAIYARAFMATADELAPDGACVIGLGCGGGQKDAMLLLTLWRRRGVPIAYWPCDASLPLVLTAARAAEGAAPGTRIAPVVCDLSSADLAELLAGLRREAEPERRVITFFGMLPNFEPEKILRRLAALLGENDILLLSANLAPGADYAAGVAKVMGGYDNALTRDWLMEFLLDIGIDHGDGEIRFAVEDGPNGLKRIVVDYIFARARELDVCGEHFVFPEGERVRLFFSYRHTPDLLRELLRQHGLETAREWIADSGEEGVFLCRKARAA